MRHLLLASSLNVCPIQNVTDECQGKLFNLPHIIKNCMYINTTFFSSLDIYRFGMAADNSFVYDPVYDAVYNTVSSF